SACARPGPAAPCTACESAAADVAPRRRTPARRCRARCPRWSRCRAASRASRRAPPTQCDRSRRRAPAAASARRGSRQEAVEVGADRLAKALAQARSRAQLGAELADLLDRELGLGELDVGAREPVPQPPRVAGLHGLL